jgi:glycosyltransferase involved in cell wall biosynthesis
MRILLLNQFFWPDAAPTGALAADLVRELAARGHQVTVLCSRQIYSDAGASTPAPPAEILRTGSARYSRKHSGRLLSWTSFLLAAAWRSLRLPPPDLVLAMTTPPGLALIGLLLKRRFGSRLWIWEMDLYPDVAAAVGTLKTSSPLYRAARRILTDVRREADGILVLGECMRERLLAAGIERERIVIAENWADGAAIRPQAFPGLPPLRILYSGNLGLVHDTGTILGAMRRLAGHAGIEFRFAGDGARRGDFEEECRRAGIDCAVFEPYCEAARLPERLAGCHVGLVTLRPACSGTVVPSKLYSLLAAGRAVLFIGPGESAAARLIERHGCGWVVRPGDVEAAVGILQQLAREPWRIHEAGARARSAFEEHYDLPLGVGRIVAALEALAAPVRPEALAAGATAAL